MESIPKTAKNHRKKPLPSEIMHEVETLPPYLRKEAEKGYVGLKVDWELKLLDVDTDEREEVINISAYHKEAVYPAIYFDVDINEYPEVRTINVGDEFNVLGEIGRISGVNIYLKDCELRFN
jgi:hypothetical protein